MRNRIEALVGVGLGIIGLAAIGYFLYQATGAGPEPVMNIPAYEVVDLGEAYEQALAVAQSQSADAQLVSATTQWNGASEREILAGAGDWTFSFYLPGESRSLYILVSKEPGRIVNQKQVNTAPAILEVGSWKEKPEGFRDALLIFLAHGGRDFLEQHPEAAVNLHLSQESGRPAWTVTGATFGEGLKMVSVQIDAETMEVLFSRSEESE